MIEHLDYASFSLGVVVGALSAWAGVGVGVAIMLWRGERG
jgi:hypothetical protein